MTSVDVIVPCYRYGHFLRQCVQSVLFQQGVEVRVLVIDDASPDNTASVAQELCSHDPRVTFVRHVTNKGHISTYNEGIEWASADYFLLLSADDYLLPGALSRSANLMDLHPEVGFTFGRAIELWDGSADEISCHKLNDVGTTGARVLTGLEFIELCASDNFVKTPTAVVRTALQKRVGGYRHELPHTGDMEMWLRVAAHSSVGAIGAYQAVYRRHSDNMSWEYSKGLSDITQHKSALDCFFQTCSHVLPDPTELRLKLMWSLGCRAIGFASTAFNEGNSETSERLADFALAVCPEVSRSWPWRKLRLKRCLGSSAWALVKPVLGKSREAPGRERAVDSVFYGE